MPWKHLKAAEKWESCLKSNWAATAFTDKPVRSCCAALSRRMAAQSLFGNYEGRCGEGFWPWPRRRVPSIPAAGCKERANAGHGQKTRRPEGFRGKGRLASLLLSRRSTRDILLRRASPSGLFPENSAPRSFQTGSKRFREDDTCLIAINLGDLAFSYEQRHLEARCHCDGRFSREPWVVGSARWSWPEF